MPSAMRWGEDVSEAECADGDAGQGYRVHRPQADMAGERRGGDLCGREREQRGQRLRRGGVGDTLYEFLVRVSGAGAAGRAELGGAYGQEAEADCADEFEGGDCQRRHVAAVTVAVGNRKKCFEWWIVPHVRADGERWSKQALFLDVDEGKR